GMWNIKGLINSSNTNDRLNFDHDAVGTIFTLTGDGNVGIGNSNPTTKFSVNGSTWPLQELKVNTSEYSSLRFENQNTGYWDVAGKIGTTNSQDRLNFYHDAAGNVMSITGEGKVGINNINPSTTFSVNGSTWPLQELKVGNNGYCSLRFSNQNSGYWDVAGIINASNTDDRLNFYHDGAGNIMTLTGGGNVGIGTTSPTYKLSVNGTIRAKEIRVETGWSDFVFEDDFRLRPLEEVQKYIQENKHLPDVTSASEIQANGLPVAEVMTEMMQKIEELTLYVIGLKKDNADLHRQLDKAEHQN
ncbi:MAG TPA: hypothetical protein VJ508_00170, partial [Saprospiraceae bacterium]|nr:hypothetical protein [Saprospiraceae bacterium]